MKLRKVISGGQTGADQAGIIEARKLGLETGGWAPRGWRTEDGAAPWLEEYGLKQHPSSRYPPRTIANVNDSDCTFWFGNIGSPGYWCTRNACVAAGKPFKLAATSSLRVEAESYEVINIAGNRLSKNPTVYQTVVDAFATLKEAK